MSEALTGTITATSLEEARSLRELMVAGRTLQLVTEDGSLIHLRLVRERSGQPNSFDWVGTPDESLYA